ncbi:MAG TPA: membrane dipeptidase [Anaerolineales bacterium]|nr:membrane dipeptidase [Anaerolineales bacterium]
MPLIVDSHCDLAWNMLNYGRDYTRSAAETRRLEAGSLASEKNGDSLLGWPDYQRGQVAIVFATLFAAPARSKDGEWDKTCYASYDEARRLYLDQMHLYHDLAESKPDHFRLLTNVRQVKGHLVEWRDPAREKWPVGLVVLMEGADAIRSPDELAEWHELGLRLVGLAWSRTRYAGGTREPGPLTEDGRRLLRAMADFNFTLDLSHMDEQSALESLDLYEGPIAATHVNCLTLLPNFPSNRHFSDHVLRRIVERDGIIGNVPLNSFLKSGWSRKNGSRREEVPLDTLAAHMDHICQIAGDSLHVGIGSDFDGGFGVQSVPPEIDTVADLQNLVPLLRRRGYSEMDSENILGGNWMRFLEQHLPS